MASSTATAAKVVAAAKRALGSPGPTNTCVSNGMQRFAREAGAPALVRKDGTPTASITEARVLGAAGVNGWRYSSSLEGVQPGDQVDWARPAGIFHVSTVIEVRRSGGKVVALRTIGSGGPSQLVNWQPAAGNPAGWNVAAYFRGYWRIPYAAPAKVTKAPAKTPAPKAPAATGGRYVAARSGDSLSTIAARAKVSLDRVKALNAKESPAPKYPVRIGQRVRVQ